MLITKRSAVSGKIHQQEIAVTEEQLTAWRNGMLIQEVMPHLTANEREFIKTGITPDEWEEMFSGPES